MKKKKGPPFEGGIPPERFAELAARRKEFHDPDPGLKTHWREGKSPENAWSRAWLTNNIRSRRAEIFTLFPAHELRIIHLVFVRAEHKFNKQHFIAQEAAFFAEWSPMFDGDPAD
jgi:hypothetical protein